MKGLYFDGQLQLKTDLAEPTLIPGEAVIETRMAGICNTDLEISKGYMGFHGVLGHEFVGTVVECTDSSWLGKRVVGEINCAPVADPRHQPGRTVLGILGRDGAMSERFLLPVANLLAVDDSVPDEVAVFTEPVAAGFEILEQVELTPQHSVAVMGDGKLGSLITQVLKQAGCAPLAVGKHEEKLALLKTVGCSVATVDEFVQDEQLFDVVVEATGNATALAIAMNKVKPRGTLVLKTTTAEPAAINWAPVVINEITVVGSRCGRFAPALKALTEGTVTVQPWIEAIFPLDQAEEAFARARRRGSRKILLQP